MTELVLSIAGHRLRVVGGASAIRVPYIDGMQSFIEYGKGFDATLMTDQSLVLPNCGWLYDFEFPDAHCHCYFGLAEDGAYYFTYDSGQMLRYHPQKTELMECSECLDPTKLRFLLWMAVTLMGTTRSFTLVHSSTLMAHGYGVLFLGESGTGKSTHTRLWREVLPEVGLLNDDSPAIGFNAEGAPTVWGSPWSGKTPCYRRESYPIKAIVRLEQRPSNRISRLSPLEAFSALQPSFPPALSHEEKLMDAEVGMISRLVTAVPFYRLGCLPNHEAAILCYNTIFGDGRQAHC